MDKNLAINCYTSKQYFSKAFKYDGTRMGDAKKAIADNLDRLMKERRLTQKELEKQIKRHVGEVAQRTISNVLNPKDNYSPTVDTAEKIARFFGLELWQLCKTDFAQGGVDHDLNMLIVASASVILNQFQVRLKEEEFKDVVSKIYPYFHGMQKQQKEKLGRAFIDKHIAPLLRSHKVIV